MRWQDALLVNIILNVQREYLSLNENMELNTNFGTDATEHFMYKL